MSTSDPVTIVDYGMGNLGSIANMIKKLGGQPLIGDDATRVKDARKLILPGVGAFDAGMTRLQERGMISALERKVRDEKTIILGICLGMQLLTKRSDEGRLPGLGWLDAETRRLTFPSSSEPLRIPHMGWNTVTPSERAPLFEKGGDPWRFYFVHSYFVECTDPSKVMSTTSYGIEFTSGVMHDNIFGVQFHPEKSHAFGMRFLRKFIDL